MRTIKLISLFVIISLLLGGTALAESEYAATTDPSHAVFGARPLGMGGAFVGVSDDTNAIFLNPAGLAQLDKWEITSLSTQILEKVNYMLLGGAMKMGPGTLGVGYIGVTAPAGITRNEYGTPEGTSISHDSHLAVLSYGVNMTELMEDSSDDMGTILVGANLKYLMKSFNGIDGATGGGVNLDLGLIFKPSNGYFTFGAAMQNVLQDGAFSWASGTKENPESKTKIGGSIKLFGKDSMYQDIKSDVTLNLDVEIAQATLFHIGAEWKPIEMVTLRAGIDQASLTANEASNNLTAGVGFNLGGFRFDYAYHTDENIETNTTHYISMSYSPEDISSLFARTEEKKEEVKKPEAKEKKHSEYDKYFYEKEEEEEVTDVIDDYFDGDSQTYIW